MRQVVSSKKIAPPVGPFSAAVISNGLLYASGQIALDPATSALAGQNVADQTEQVFRNIAFVLEAAGKTFTDVIKTTVYLKDMRDFAAMNAIYATHFEAPFPARTTIQAAALPLGALVEIEVVAQ